MRLSVVVTIVEGGATLVRCLAALSNQQNPPACEVIVPWDDTVPDTPGLAATFPDFRFLRMGQVPTLHAAASAAGQHELFDRRRAAGLAQASGDIIAILEDRGVPRPEWAETLIRVHERLPHAVIGGAIENRGDTVLHWAVYFCDFNRYQRPFEAGARAYVSDVNIGYKRRAIEATRHLWRDRYHETTVHWALQNAGETLYLTPEFVVDQHRGRLSFGALIRERFAWGRLFAYTRARETGGGKRIVLGALAPLLPGLLLIRHARLQWSKRINFRRFVAASPIVLVLLAAWSVGETVGYITARP
jgi:GT2 family glycosyltransferase